MPPPPHLRPVTLKPRPRVDSDLSYNPFIYSPIQFREQLKKDAADIGKEIVVRK